jgi:hypothetical protein
MFEFNILHTLQIIHYIKSQTLQLMDTNSKDIFQKHLSEMLKKSANFSYLVSKRICTGGYNSSSCCWYHSAWQYLRIIDKVSSPTWHLDFYFDTLIETIKEGSKILISGTADYSLLALIFESARFLNVKVDLTVTDICDTPLLLCEWYASEMNFSISTIQGNILELKNLGDFDIVITDAFLTRFSKSDKKAIIKKWLSFLTNQGNIITTIRIGHGIEVKASDVEKEIFIQDAIREINLYDNIFPESIRDLINDYANNIISYPFDNENDMDELFSNLAMKNIFFHPVAGEFRPTDYCLINYQKSG